LLRFPSSLLTFSWEKTRSPEPVYDWCFKSLLAHSWLAKGSFCQGSFFPKTSPASDTFYSFRFSPVILATAPPPPNFFLSRTILFFWLPPIAFTRSACHHMFFPPSIGERSLLPGFLPIPFNLTTHDFFLTKRIEEGSPSLPAVFFMSLGPSLYPSLCLVQPSIARTFVGYGIYLFGRLL